jgi:hypothetical protein
MTKMGKLRCTLQQIDELHNQNEPLRWNEPILTFESSQSLEEGQQELKFNLGNAF